MPTIHPLNKHVVVKRADPVRKQGALYLPDNASEKPQHAEVMAVDINQDGGPKVSVGDIVLLPKWSGVEVEYNGRTFLLVKEDDILAVIGQEVPSPVGPTLNDFFKYSPEWADVVTTDSEWANLLMESVLEVSGGDVHYAAGLDKTRHAFNVFLAHDSGLRGERADRFASVLRDAAVAFDKRMTTTTRLAAGQVPAPAHDESGL